MKTLNDDITVTLEVYARTVGRYSNYYITENTSSNALYIGRIWTNGVPGVATQSVFSKVTVNIADILKSDMNISNYLIETGVNEVELVSKYKVIVEDVYDGEHTIWRQYSLPLIHMRYDYGFADYYNGYIKDTSTLSRTAKTTVQIPILGHNSDSSLTLELYPRYPLFGDNNPDNFNFVLMVQIGSSINDLLIVNIKDNKAVRLDDINASAGTFVYSNDLETLFDNAGDIKEIGVASAKAFGATTVITGKKLNVVEIMADSSDSQRWNQLLLFFQDLGYDDFFMHKCYVIDESTQLKQYFLVYEGETNKATRLIAEKYPLLLNWYIGTTENVASVNNWYLRYRLTDMHTIADRNERYNFTLFLTEFFPVDEEYVETVWDINESRTSDIVDLPLPYILYDDNALETIRYHFEEGFESMEGYCYDDFFDADSGQDAGTTYPSTYKEESIPNYIKIADIDCTPAKYYLQWYDRFGGIQCLPFNGKEVKLIDYSITNIENEYREKRYLTSDNNYTFDITSGWITQDKYKFYESIFVSPYLMLYDANRRMAHKVIINDKQFQEKTYKNQKKLINLNIKLSINKTENILY